jgi:hypothetical protein
MSVQVAVEERHRNRCRDPDGLAETVQEAWNNLPGPTITRIFNRIPIVLQQIVSSGGDNITVEKGGGVVVTSLLIRQDDSALLLEKI